MVCLGHMESDVDFKAEQFRRHNEETPIQSFAFFEDDAVACSLFQNEARRTRANSSARYSEERECVSHKQSQPIHSSYSSCAAIHALSAALICC